MFRRRKPARRHFGRRFLVILLIAVIAFGVFNYTRPLPTLRPAAETLKAQTVEPVMLAWPAAPEAAIGAAGYGVLSENGSQTARPIASTAKLITALTVLKRYPLTANESGPTLTLSAADMALYNQYAAEGGSVVPVTVGEQITERQVLEAMMLPSANNMADSLAVWAFGSLTAYKTAATEYVQSLGLSQTTIGSDASGFLPDTVSSAHDLVLIGEAALANPALAAIVDESQATIPVAGAVSNVNWLLGTDGIIGIKTGNTNQAGGVYIFAATDNLDAAHNITIVGAIVDSDNLQDAINSGVPLLDSAKQNFKLNTVLSTDQVVGHYDVPWAQPVAAVASQPLSAVTWAGQTAKPTIALNTIHAPKPTNARVGSANLNSSTSPVVLSQAIPSPPWWWRLIRHKF